MDQQGLGVGGQGRSSDIYLTASKLRTRFGDPAARATYTHIPTSASPSELLARLRTSALEPLVAPTNAVLSDPDVPWHVPLQLVSAADANACGVRLTASTGKAEASELTIALRYHQGLTPGSEFSAGLAYAQQVWNLYSYGNGRVLLQRYAYAEERAATGYEGDQRLDFDATDERISAFLGIVGALSFS